MKACIESPKAGGITLSHHNQVKLVTLIKQPQVDEQHVLAQLEKVLVAESEVKHQQVTLLVRIKNKLTPEQQAKLSDLRAKPSTK